MQTIYFHDVSSSLLNHVTVLITISDVSNKEIFFSVFTKRSDTIFQHAVGCQT